MWTGNNEIFFQRCDSDGFVKKMENDYSLFTIQESENNSLQTEE